MTGPTATTRREDPGGPATNRPRAGLASGSAYVVTLLALVVLTILGLSLVLVTQSEMQIGVTERVVQRVFYAADAGIAATTARALVMNDYSERTVTLLEPDSNATLDSRSNVDISPLVPILDAPCNLCEINNAGTYGARAYRRVTHAVTVNAERIGGASGTRTAFKAISAMIDLQPWMDPPQAFLPIDDPEILAEIRF